MIAPTPPPSDEFARRKDRRLATLITRRPNTRPPVSEWNEVGLCLGGLVLVLAACVALGWRTVDWLASALFVHAPRAGMGYWLARGFFALLYSSAAWWFLSLGQGTKDAPHEALGFRLVACIQRRFTCGPALTQTQAQEVSDMCRRHPLMQEACIRWLAANPARTLTIKDYLFLRSIDRDLADLDNYYAGAAQVQASKDQVASILNRHGLIDAAQRLAEANTLQKTTPQAPARTPPRRL